LNFSDRELDSIWNALAQYVENRDLESDVEDAHAASALEKLDRRKAAMAVAPPAGGLPIRGGTTCTS
jgi:hypothetical protein